MRDGSRYTGFHFGARDGKLSKRKFYFKINKINYFIEIAIIFAVLVISAMKNDVNILLDSEYWSELTNSYVVAFMKIHSQKLFLLIMLLSAVFIMKIRVYRLAVPGSILMLIILLIYASFRSLLVDISISLKYAGGASIFFCVMIFFSLIISNYGRRSLEYIIFKSMYIFSIYIVTCNMINLFTGNGFVDGIPRMFGTAGHPNFTGVQLALSCVVFYYAFFSSNDKFYYLINSVYLIFSMYLIYLTGSRTAILMAASGIIFTWWSVKGFSILRAIRAFGALMFIAFISFNIADIDVNIDKYSRAGDIDTRSAAWGDMLDVIIDKPIFGKPDYTDASENSYLKAWSRFGIFELIFLLIIIFSNIYRTIRKIIETEFDKSNSLFFGLIISLSFGGFFEGFLIDSFSAPLTFFALISGVPSKGPYLRRACGMDTKVS